MPVYKDILGANWDRLPPEIRHFHDFETSRDAEGIAEVRRGRNPLGNLACFILGLPKAGTNIPLSARITIKDEVGTWTRTFAGRSFRSLQYAGQGSSEGLLVERIGILTFGLALLLKDGRLNLVLRQWRVLGIPLPMWLCVRSESLETVESGRYAFSARLWHPLTGLIILLLLPSTCSWLSSAIT
jgi:hypothetical protein